MASTLAQLKLQEPLRNIPEKDECDVRFVTFNVNGSKTLFNYFPWNKLSGSVDSFLHAFNADIVSLQELKIQHDAVSSMGLTERYKAFISVPKSKKGYSGVGLYVRNPKPQEPECIRQALTVIKAEEGITGKLSDSGGKTYKDSGDSIGGYADSDDLTSLSISESELQTLDSEGRCAVVETANNTVVFSLYCPANSMGTPEGHVFRINFLNLLFLRCAKLKAMGKKVVVMGDINVSPDLIDNAEYINELIKKKRVVNNLKDGGQKFEHINEFECLEFRNSGDHRTLLNTFMHPSLGSAPTLPTQFLHDTTRLIQKRKLALYTVWNTMTNARQSNYGSRIDLILVSHDEDQVTKADILPFLHGSDHCPVFTDMNVSHQPIVLTIAPPKLAFEAKTHYKLVKHVDIASMFSAVSKKKSSLSPSCDQEKPNKRIKTTPTVTYASRKSTKPIAQQPIQNFFFSPKPKVEDDAAKVEQSRSATPFADNKINVVEQFAAMVYSNPPLCQHKEPCVLKTSRTPASKGKKFWCCARDSKGSTAELGEHRCSFFEWATKPDKA